MTYPYPSVGVISSADLLQDSRVFPQLPGIDFLVEKVPIFSTGVKSSSSGREIRSAYYPYPLYRFKVRANVLRNTAAKNEVQKLLGFFNSQQGRYGAWFYLEQEDFTVEADNFGIGDGETETFQLMRTVGKGTPFTASEPVYACWQSPTIYVDGVQSASYTISPWAKVTFTVPPADGAVLTWTGKRLNVCRFEDDEMSLQQMVSLLWSQDGLEFQSIRP